MEQTVTNKVPRHRRRSAEKQATYYRNYRRARDRALTRLAKANPAQYRAFLEEEREKDRQEKKEWADLSGSPVLHPDNDADMDRPEPDHP